MGNPIPVSIRKKASAKLVVKGDVELATATPNPSIDCFTEFQLIDVWPLTTVKVIPLLAWPPTITSTLPVAAPVGTGATILVTLQLFGVAFTPPKVTALVPCVAPKFAPVITIAAPTAPEPGLTFERLGAGWITVKLEPLLACPPTVTTT
jgi:hypothetical protein